MIFYKYNYNVHEVYFLKNKIVIRELTLKFYKTNIIFVVIITLS